MGMRRNRALAVAVVGLGLIVAACAGTPDESFSSDGHVSTVLSKPSQAQAVAVQADGKVVVAGVVHKNGDDVAVTRFTSGGSLDGTFGFLPSGSGTRTGTNTFDKGGSSADAGQQLRIVPGGKLVVGATSVAS